MVCSPLACQTGDIFPINNIISMNESAKQSLDEPAHSKVTIHRRDPSQWFLAIVVVIVVTWLTLMDGRRWEGMLEDADKSAQVSQAIFGQSPFQDARLHQLAHHNDNQQLVKCWGFCINRRRNQWRQSWHIIGLHGFVIQEKSACFLSLWKRDKLGWAVANST